MVRISTSTERSAETEVEHCYRRTGSLRRDEGMMATAEWFVLVVVGVAFSGINRRCQGCKQGG